MRLISNNCNDISNLTIRRRCKCYLEIFYRHLVAFGMRSRRDATIHLTKCHFPSASPGRTLRFVVDTGWTCGDGIFLTIPSTGRESCAVFTVTRIVIDKLFTLFFFLCFRFWRGCLRRYSRGLETFKIRVQAGGARPRFLVFGPALCAVLSALSLPLATPPTDYVTSTNRIGAISALRYSIRIS